MGRHGSPLPGDEPARRAEGSCSGRVMAASGESGRALDTGGAGEAALAASARWGLKQPHVARPTDPPTGGRARNVVLVRHLHRWVALAQLPEHGVVLCDGTK